MSFCNDCQVRFKGISCPSCDLQFQQEIEALDERIANDPSISRGARLA